MFPLSKAGTLFTGMSRKKRPGKLEEVQAQAWTLPFTSKRITTKHDNTDENQNIKYKVDKILTNYPNVNKSIMEILIGIKARNNEPEEQLLSNAKRLIPTLTMKNWSTWCILINNRDMKRSLEHEMDQIMIYDPTENLGYLIKKVLDQNYNSNQTNNLDCNGENREGITNSQTESRNGEN